MEKRTQSLWVKPEYKEAANKYFEDNKKEISEQSGMSKYAENIKLNMPNKRIFRNNALESARQFTYKLLDLGDAPFFKNAYVDRLANYAQAKGIKDFSN